ncbi:hypothetical protein Tco_1229010 [Tanacetum coccineum]
MEDHAPDHIPLRTKLGVVTDWLFEQVNGIARGPPYVEAALKASNPTPDYVPGPEEPEQAPPLPDYVPGPEHTNDEIVAEDQPGAKDASPTTQSPDYVPVFDPKADPEEDDD